uniref:Uncharacterized protein n=1 Tax=Physcomitrium patens TaxID=3218 RepID=A0A2K1L1N2_PHYPA|nr:hypothetical protein PHYPA_002713 [Physcomitrium patens]
MTIGRQEGRIKAAAWSAEIPQKLAYFLNIQTMITSPGTV